MSYQSNCEEILALFVATGKDVPHKDSNMGVAIQILQEICDQHNHTIPAFEAHPNNSAEENQEEAEALASDIFEALEELESQYSSTNADDFTLDFDGNEYRLIKKAAIWEIYVDEIKNVVEDCYDLNLDKVPSFIAVYIDWEQTAKNAYVDGYGHQFSSYDGSEFEAAGYYIFRTN